MYKIIAETLSYYNEEESWKEIRMNPSYSTVSFPKSLRSIQNYARKYA